MKKKILSLILIIMIISSIEVQVSSASETMRFTLKQAINFGLSNNLTLKQVSNEHNLADVKQVTTSQLRDALISGQSTYDSSSTQISVANTQLLNSQTTINQALSDIDNDLAPQDISLNDDFKISAKSNIQNYLITIVKPAIINEINQNIDSMEAHGVINGAEAAQMHSKINDDGVTPFEVPVTSTIVIPTDTVLQDYLKNQANEIIVNQIKSQIQEQQADLLIKQIQLNTSKDSFNKGTVDIEVSRKAAETVLCQKLNISDLSKLTTEEIGDLMVSMAMSYDKIMDNADNLSKAQVALLIQKNFYDALKAKQISDVKNDAIYRAQKQFDFANSSYEIGMKSKDEMLQAKMYLTSTKLEYKKALNDYSAAITELKKSMGLNLSVNIELDDEELTDDFTVLQYDNGLQYGLGNRLEVIQAKEETGLYQKLFDLVKERYGEGSKVYGEAYFLNSKANINLDNVKQEVESSIKESYDNFNTAKEMLDESKDLIEDAKENVEIAQARYEEGYGVDSTMLKNLNLEASSGTILEVIAAEENQLQIEQKVIEIKNTYKLARIKYLSDIVQTQY